MISAVDSPKVGAMIYDGSKMNQFRSMKGHMFIAAMVLIFSITNIESARDSINVCPVEICTQGLSGSP